MAKIRFTANYQSHQSDFRSASISYEVKTSDLNARLFCYPGTDIFAHDFVRHVAAPEWRPKQEDEVDLPFGTRYGSSEVTVIGGKWYFCGDFEHCNKDDIKHNIRILRTLLERLITNYPTLKPFSLHKDYDEDICLYVEGDGSDIDEDEFEDEFAGIHFYDCCPADKFEPRTASDYDRYDRLMPWEQFETYDPPLPSWYLERERRSKEVHENCPLCANREYLEKLGELEPETTGDEHTDNQLAMNYDYHKKEDLAPWALNWVLLKNKFEVENAPKCTQCGKPIFTGTIFGCDLWVERVKNGLCNEHDPEWQRARAEVERQTRMAKSNCRYKGLVEAASNEKQKPLAEFGF